MKVVAWDKLGRKFEHQVDRVVVFDDMDNAVLVSLKIVDGTIFCATPAEPKALRAALQMVGIDSTLVIDAMPKPEPLAIR